MTAIEVFEQYVRSCNMNLKHFHLTIDSNLADNSGQKYGLGSSAAVLVSVVKALNEFYGLELSNLYIYKLAVIANMKLQSLSSCGDIAVSVYSGWLAYSTFDHDWVKQQMEETSVNDVLKKLARLTYRTFTSSRKYGSPYWMDWVSSFFSTLSE